MKGASPRAWGSAVGVFALTAAVALCACGDLQRARRADGRVAAARPTEDPAADHDGTTGEARAAMDGGYQAVARGDWPAAEDAFRRAHGLAPAAAAPLLDLGLVLTRLGRPDEALDALARARANAPTDTAPGQALRRRIDVARANAHLDRGDRHAARALLEPLTEQHPELGDAWYALGRVYLAFSRAGLAADAFWAALDADPDDEDALRGLVVALANTPSSPAFAEAAQRARDRLPDDPIVLTALGSAAEATGHLGEARALYLRALELAPDQSIANHNLARIIHEADGLKAARPYYEAFVRGAPPWLRGTVDEVREILESTR